MDANFAISTQSEELLELRYRPFARLLTGAVMLCFGGVILSGAAMNALEPPFDQGAWKQGLAALGSLMALYGIHALLNRKTIRVDRGRHVIEMNGRFLGLWSRRSIIPFRDVARVELVWHQDPEGGPYWDIVLRGSGRLGGRTLDASSDESYVRRVGGAMAQLIGCPLSRSEYSVEAKRMRATS